MRNCIRVAICVVLVVAVLAMSLSVFAVDPTPQPTIQPVPPDPLLDGIIIPMAMRIIYSCMKAWGIDVQYNNSAQFNEEIEGMLVTWVTEYLESLPSTYTINQWIAPWQAGYDYWGNYQYNSSALEDIQDFVDWLMSKFGLNNNEEVVIDPIYVVSDGVILYDTSKYYRGIGYASNAENASIANDGAIYMTVRNSSNNEVDRHYFYVLNTDVGKYYTVFVRYSSSTSSTTNYFHVYLLNDTNAPSGSNIVDESSFYGSISYISSNAQTGLQFFQSTNDAYARIRPDGANAYIGTTQEINLFLSNLETRQVGDITIVTSDIELPSDNPSYENGDGITIIDGRPEYSQITFSGEVTNLPAIVSQGTVTNPGLDTFWGFIPVLAEETKDAIILTRGLIYEMPEELVVTFFAVMGGLILFGIIKLMREH